jgi:hypothetical protein
VLLPLDQAHLDEAVAAATTPEERLVLALAAVHAARRVDICTLTLDDVDLGNRRLVINGRSRRLDDLTRQALLDYLAYRRARWPSTANPHLLISRHTANETGPISTGRLGGLFCGITATLGRLRVDRQLEELLAWGPDPLHLAAVFGVSEKTGIRYAAAARQVLESAAEHQAPSETES